MLPNAIFDRIIMTMTVFDSPPGPISSKLLFARQEAIMNLALAVHKLILRAVLCFHFFNEMTTMCDCVA